MWKVVLGLGDHMSDVIMGVVNEFLDAVWRIRSCDHGEREAGLGRYS